MHSSKCNILAFRKDGAGRYGIDVIKKFMLHVSRCVTLLPGGLTSPSKNRVLKRSRERIIDATSITDPIILTSGPIKSPFLLNGAAPDAQLLRIYRVALHQR